MPRFTRNDKIDVLNYVNNLSIPEGYLPIYSNFHSSVKVINKMLEEKGIVNDKFTEYYKKMKDAKKIIEERRKVSALRHATILSYLKQCAEDEIENIEFPTNATEQEVINFYDDLFNRFCSSDDDIDIINYIETNDIDIDDLFGDENDVNKCIQTIKDYNLENTGDNPEILSTYSRDSLLQLYTYCCVREHMNNDDLFLEKLFGFTRFCNEEEDNYTIRKWFKIKVKKNKSKKN